MPNIMPEPDRIYSMRVMSSDKYVKGVWNSGSIIPIGYININRETFTPPDLKDIVEASKDQGVLIEESAINALGFAIHAVNHYSELEFFNE